MKINQYKLWIFLVIISCFTACESNENIQKEHYVLSVKKEKAENLTNQDKDNKKWVNYWPENVEVTGKLKVETFFGPPNFGENPKTDSKERSWILYLEEPINVKGQIGTDPLFNISVENVRKLQLVMPRPRKELIGKAVIVNGTLFHSHTGHHHTDVLIDVKTITIVP